MNWLKAIKQLLGRFWGEIFRDQDFLLGVEYLMSLYSKLTDNQYLNWRNGLIAANLDVAQSRLPILILIDVESIDTEWYQWQRLWQAGSAGLFYDHAYTTPAESSMGWTAKTKKLIDTPDYMMDHIYDYTTILVRGSDYDYVDGKFLFYVDPRELNLPVIKETDSEGNLHIYYRLFGYSLQDTKVCDPVTGFESQWLNGCSDIAWDIHTNGATYYNTKRLLGKATGSVICEADGVIESAWKEQDYYCVSVQGKPYMSKKPLALLAAGETFEANAVGKEVSIGTVLFGSLAMYNGTDTVSASQVPGIKIMTDAGQLTALNATQDTYIYTTGSNNTLTLPLSGDTVILNNYRAICAELIKDESVPYIQIPYPQVNPYEFIIKVLRRGRAVTVRLVADNLDYLAAAVKCIRNSSCTSGMLNIYVATSTDANNAATLILSEFSTSAGMMAVAVDETVKIKEECAEAKVIL